MNGNGKITGIVFDPTGAEPDMPFEGGYNPSTGRYCFEPDTNDEFCDETSPIIILIDGSFDKNGTNGDMTYLWYDIIGDGDNPRLKISQNDMMPVCLYRLDVDEPKWKDTNLREYIDGKLKIMAENALILDEEPTKLIELQGNDPLICSMLTDMGESSPVNLRNTNGEPKSPHFGKGGDTAGSLVWDPVWVGEEKSESLIKLKPLEPDPKKIPEVKPGKPPGDDPKADPKDLKDPKEESDWVWDCEGPYFLEFWEQEMPEKLYPITKQVNPKNPNYNPTETDDGPTDPQHASTSNPSSKKPEIPNTDPTAPPTPLYPPKFPPKKQWSNLSKALGFLTPSNSPPLQNHPKTLPPSKPLFTNYTIDGTFNLNNNEVPLQIQNISIQKNGQILPLQGKTDQ